MIVLPPRVHVVATEWLAAQLEKAAPDFVIDGYPEYATDVARLDSDQRYMLYRAASAVVRSFGGLTHVSAVLIVGHADTANHVALHQRAGFEVDISRKRAAAAGEALRKEMNRLSENAHFTKVLPIRLHSAGSSKRRIQIARTELEMRKNRRVEITFGYTTESSPSCGA